MTNIYELKYQACNLSDALHRNINDNFDCISFGFCKNGDIQVKIMLNKRTEVEDEYIDDLMAEFGALQESNVVLKAIVVVEKNALSLENVVYKKV